MAIIKNSDWYVIKLVSLLIGMPIVNVVQRSM